MKMKSRLAQEVLLIAVLSVGIPSAVTLGTAPLWWEAEPIKVFAGYLLGVVALAGLCVAISVHDEEEQAKKRERERYGRR